MRNHSSQWTINLHDVVQPASTGSAPAFIIDNKSAALMIVGKIHDHKPAQPRTRTHAQHICTAGSGLKRHGTAKFDSAHRGSDHPFHVVKTTRIGSLLPRGSRNAK